MEEFRAPFRDKPVGAAGEGAARMEEISGIRLSYTQARRIMVRLGLKFSKTAAVPVDATSDCSLVFIMKSSCLAWKKQSSTADFCKETINLR
jgi:hypothetical protein